MACFYILCFCDKIWVSDLYSEDSGTYLNAVMLNQNDFTDIDCIMAPSEYRSNRSEFEGSCMANENSLRTFAELEW